MKFKLCRLKRLKFPIDLDDSTQVECFKDDLIDKWGFDKNRTEKILRKYRGQLQKHSAMHAEIMYNLLRGHLKSLAPNKQQAYIISKKVNYSALQDVSALEFIFSIFFDIALAGTIVAILSTGEKLLWLGILFALGIAIIIISLSKKPRFCQEILASVESSLLKGDNDD